MPQDQYFLHYVNKETYLESLNNLLQIIYILLMLIYLHHEIIYVDI